MNEQFGERVKRARVDRHWTQQELSLRSRISTPHISSLEKGKRSPSMEYALRLANALGVPIQSLCDEETEFRPPKMKSSPDELPISIQNFVLNEASAPYLHAAQRMSTLPPQDSEFLSLMIDLLVERRKSIS